MRSNLQLVKSSRNPAYRPQGAAGYGPQETLRETSQPRQEEREVRYRYPADEEIWEVSCDGRQDKSRAS